MKYIANPVEVEAWEITSVVPVSDPEPQAYMLSFGDRERCLATSAMCSRMEPKVGDYLVRQPDGYEYLNPKDVFKRKYTSLAQLPGLSDFERIVSYQLRHIQQSIALNTTMLESLVIKRNSPGPQ